MEPADSFEVLYEALFINDREKKLQTLRTLIDSGVDVNTCWNGDNTLMVVCEPKWFTVLMVAARQGYVDCVQVLLNAGANVNQSDVEGQTALIVAARFASGECMELLLKAGANVNDVDMDGNTALIHFLNCICFHERKGTACLKLLIDAGADIDVRNNKHFQPIHYALRGQRVTFLVKYLISENCNLNHASYDQVKACIDEGYVDFLELDVNGRLDMLKLLFACGLPRHLCQSFIVEQDTSVRNWVDTVASQPNTLKSICVFEIRRSLGLGIKSKVTKLNLHYVIQNLILLKGILSFECFN